MSRILVTGAGGFIGSHLARELHQNGDFVRAVDIKWDGYIEEPYYSEKCTLDHLDSRLPLLFLLSLHIHLLSVL